MHNPSVVSPWLAWLPLFSVLGYAAWCDIRTGLIPRWTSMALILWAFFMHHMGTMTVFMLSPLIVCSVLLALYALFFYTRNRVIFGGGDLKLITSCAFVIHPTDVGLWMLLMGLGTLVTRPLYATPYTPMGPVIAISTAIIVCKGLVLF